MNKHEFFFQNPKYLPDNQKVFSTLFLLRRDIFTSFGINPNDNSKIGFQVLFPGTMAIMAGIDLLSKFYCTEDEIPGNKSGDRFKKFVSNYIDTDNTETIYQLRNSLLHSFGLYSKDRNGNEYNFILDQNMISFIQKIDGKNYIISIRILLDRFENAILKYSNDILNNDLLITNFNQMFENYGQICVKK